MSLTSKQIDDLRAYAKDRKGELAKLINDAADTIEMLSSKQPEPKWIPFDEQQPEYRQEILVTIHWHESGEEEYFVQFDTYVDDATLDSNFKIGRDAFAWMPIPEPYREGEQE